jgi:hypothetical protein
MSIETDLERAIFLDTDIFGVSVTFTPDGGSPVSISAILEDHYDSTGNDQIEVETRNPVILCRDSDVSGIAHQDSVSIGSNSYLVVEVIPDGQGLTSVRLELQGDYISTGSFSVETDLERAIFLSTDDFGVEARYTSQIDGISTINVLMENHYWKSSNVFSGSESRNPYVMCKLSDVPNIQHGDSFLINSYTYIVVELIPDGQGFINIRLQWEGEAQYMTDEDGNYITDEDGRYIVTG